MDFFLYSFLGWCTEVIFQTFKTGEFINRGFLIGPVCPIYGFGVAAVVLLIDPIADHLFQAYLVAALVPTILEYLVGWLTEKILHTRLWDYSKMPLNINGYVCLLFSLIWGAACLIVYYFIHPALMSLVRLIPTVVGWILLAAFTITILADFIITGISALKIPKTLDSIEEVEAGLRKLSDAIGEALSDGAMNIRERELEKQPQREEAKEKFAARTAEAKERFRAALEPYKQILGTKNATQERLRKAFPHFDHSKGQKSLERAKELYRSLRERIDK